MPLTGKRILVVEDEPIIAFSLEDMLLEDGAEPPKQLRLYLSGFAVLFTGKYPKGMHDFQVGNLRWGLRVMAYMTMLSDKYPPFSGKP